MKIINTLDTAVDQFLTAYRAFSTIVEFGLTAEEEGITPEDHLDGEYKAKKAAFQTLHNQSRATLGKTPIALSTAAYVLQRLRHPRVYPQAHEYLERTFYRHLKD